MSSASSGVRRVAFFGGSFDPPHLGHIAVAEAAQQALDLDRILFVPVGLQPLKPLGSSASFEDRLAMLRLAIAGHPCFEISLLDAPKPNSPSPNYTYETLAELRQSLPPASELFLLLGADSFRTLQHWHRAAELLFLASLIVAPRPGESLGDLPSILPAGIALNPIDGQANRYRLTGSSGNESRLILLPDLRYDISATQLRSQIQNPGDDPSNDPNDRPPLLNPSVLAYIRAHRLYT